MDDVFLYMSSNAAAGAVSRKSMNSKEPLGALTSIKPPPPIPLWYIPENTISLIDPVWSSMRGLTNYSDTEDCRDQLHRKA